MGKRAVLLALAVWLACPQAAMAAGKVDYDPWARLLADHVNGGVVDYAGFGKDRDRLDGFLAELDRVEPADLSREGQKALWINAYNAYTIKLILTRYPDLKSIKDLGGLFSSPWELEIVHVGGHVYTLDDVEHKILRQEFKDPRVHFAINCASKSCPPLLSAPYLPQTLDAQLDQVTRAFINDPTRTYLQGDSLFVSRIFKWFGEDFGDDPVRFVRRYALGEFLRRLEDRQGSGGLEVEYLPYDWSLNSR